MKFWKRGSVSGSVVVLMVVGVTAVHAKEAGLCERDAYSGENYEPCFFQEMSVDEMAAEVRRFSRMWHGCFVEVIPATAPADVDFKGSPSDYPERYWFAADGRYGQMYTQGIHRKFKPEDCWLLIFANGEFRAQVMRLPRGPDYIRVTAEEGDLPLASNLVGLPALASGWVVEYASRTEDLLDQYLPESQIEVVDFDGQSLRALMLPTPYGRVWFGFHEGHVRYVRTESRAGVRVPDFTGSTKIVKFGEELEDKGVVAIENTVGPVLYEDDQISGIGAMSLHPSSVWVKSDGTKERPHAREVDHSDNSRDTAQLTVRPLKPGEFSLERIDVEAFGIPERLPALVPDSVVPYELRDGRLVKLVDARAQEVARESGFRRPSFWSRFRVFIIAFIAIVVGGVGWAIYRGRVE